jgi:amidase
MRLTRRGVLLVAAGAALPGRGEEAGFSVEERSLAELSELLGTGAVTPPQLVKAYLARIDRVDVRGPALRSVLEVNPDAERLAAELERGAARGPLYGLPLLVKDNLDTADAMKTTAGSLALLDAPTPRQDAEVVRRLRAAGAVLLGKANLSEWSNSRSRASTSGWSARGGLTRNPYVLTRNTSGSSSGPAAAVAASLCAAAIGTETDGSIVSPASACGIVGFKPSRGVVPAAGIIPLAHSQDTAGPMARTVRDAALVMDTIGSRGAVGERAYSAALTAATLQGARLGVLRPLVDALYAVAPLMKETLARLAAAGATLIEVELPTGAWGEAEPEVFLFELKADLGAYLAARGGPMRSLADVIAFNEAHADRELAFFGQDFFLAAQQKGPLTSAAYKKALAACGLARSSLHALLARHKLDALVAPTESPAWLTDFVLGDHLTYAASGPAAVAGTPHLTVPMGFVGELPVGCSFMGAAGADAKVLALGHAFEQLTRARKPPRYFEK